MILHARLNHVTAQAVALHICLPTALPGALSLCTSLPVPPSAMFVGGRQFHSRGLAIFLPVEAYMISHVNYLC